MQWTADCLRKVRMGGDDRAGAYQEDFENQGLQRHRGEMPRIRREASGCRPMIFEKVGRLWGARAKGRSSIGSVSVHIATAAAILFTAALARGQQPAEPDGEKIKLY